MKHIHILGICGTFMAGIATIAKQLGYIVTGQDQNCYPPMSTYLESLGITLASFDEPMPEADELIVGNIMARGMPIVEQLLNEKATLISGPEWLYENALKYKKVLCVAGTHGKTTTSSMLAWILEANDLNPSFLIGGLPGNFDVSARYTDGDYFVIEGDEYDTAFFDKRSKFIHYRPDVFVINNLEFDHADIFDDLKMIQTQFHHALKLIPENGSVISESQSPSIQAVLDRGLFSQHETCGALGQWQAKLIDDDGSEFDVYDQNDLVGRVNWDLLGAHNVQNALSAIAAANHAGVLPVAAIKALNGFKGVKRRLELVGEVNGVRVYDDFAHHPSAITSTLEGLKKHVKDGRVIAILEPRSATMKQGCHQESLLASLQKADLIFLYQSSQVKWGMKSLFAESGLPAMVFESTDSLLKELLSRLKPNDHVAIMSNGAFDNIHERLIESLKKQAVSV